MRKSLSRIERLRTRNEFTRVFDCPDYRFSCRGAKLVVKRNDLVFNRFATTLVKKYGNAVERNRARRILKEIYRNNKQNLPVGFDIIFVLYPGNFNYHEREQQFIALIQGVVLAKPNIEMDSMAFYRHC